MIKSVRVPGNHERGTASRATTHANNGLTLLCCRCRSNLNEFEMFELRGWVACEGCLPDCYRDRPNELEPEFRIRG